MYQFLSHYYETLFPYRQYVVWKDFARPIIQKSRAVQKFKDRREKTLVVDAGCGTGALADILATYYDVIGIDISEEMLDQALKNYPDKGILWVCQDISKMEVGRPAAAVFATTDTLNHITNLNQLNAFLKRAYRTLESGGYLFFDVVTEAFFKFFYEDGSCSFEDFEWGSFFWRCKYRQSTQKAVYDVTYFEKCEGREDLYRRTDEQITERVWPKTVILEGLEKAGFRNIQLYADLLFGAQGKSLLDPSLNDRDRLYFVCEKP